jgi:hypothetical protein
MTLKNSSSGNTHEFHRTRMPYHATSSTRLDISIPKGATAFSKATFSTLIEP